MCAYTMLTMGSGGGVPFLAVAKYSISWGSAHTHAYTCMHACTHARTKARMFAEVTHPDICNASTCPYGARLARHWQGVQPAQARPRGSASRRLVSRGPAVACPHRTTACGAERGQARNWDRKSLANLSAGRSARRSPCKTRSSRMKGAGGGADFFQNAACAWPRRTAATTAKTHDIRIAQSTIVASLFYIWSQFPLAGTFLSSDIKNVVCSRS